MGIISNFFEDQISIISISWWKLQRNLEFVCDLLGKLNAI